MPTYSVPKHVSAVFTPDGELRPNAKGEIHIHADAPAYQHEALRAAGCELKAGKPAKDSDAKPKAKRSSGKKRGPGPAKPPAPPKPEAAKPEGGDPIQPEG